MPGEMYCERSSERNINDQGKGEKKIIEYGIWEEKKNLKLKALSTFPVTFLSLRGHFQSLCTALYAKARIAAPEFVYINLIIWI